MDIEPNFLKMNYKLLTFAQKSVKKCHFCVKFMQNFHFLILWFRAKRDPDVLNILYFACCYVTFDIYVTIIYI